MKGDVMRTPIHDVPTAVAAKHMLEEAREMARTVSQGTRDWAFYYGVQTAAKHVLHAASHTAASDDDGWLGAESPAFRDGYVKARTALAMASVAEQPPLRVPLPQP
jgi:hypothetical protein